jgi:hypothetical protein
MSGDGCHTIRSFQACKCMSTVSPELVAVASARSSPLVISCKWGSFPEAITQYRIRPSDRN